MPDQWTSCDILYPGVLSVAIWDQSFPFLYSRKQALCAHLPYVRGPLRPAMLDCDYIILGLVGLILFCTGLGVGLALGRYCGKNSSTVTTVTVTTPSATAQAPSAATPSATTVTMPSGAVPSAANPPSSSSPATATTPSATAPPRDCSVVYMAKHSGVFHTSRSCQYIRRSLRIEDIQLCDACRKREGECLDREKHE